MCERTYERLDFDEWFKRFITVHPQLQYFKDEKDLYNLQIILEQKYKDNEHTKEEIINIYDNYIEQKRQENIKIWDIKKYYEKKVNRYIQLEKEKTRKFIKDLIKEI